MINDKQIKAERYTKAKPRRDMKPKYTVKELRDQGPGSITGFHCRIGHSSKVFYMTYKNPNTGKKRNYKLGTFPEVNCAWARSEAKKVYAKINATETEDVHQNRRAKVQDGTLTEYSRSYQNSLINQASREYERYIHERYIIPGLGTKKLFEIKTLDIETLRNKYEDKIHIANRIKVYCVKFFKWCIKNGHMKANPASGVKGFPEESKEVEWTKAEITSVKRALEKLSKDPENKVNVIYISLLFLTGRRQMELCKLKWSQVDLTPKKAKMKNVETKAGIMNFELDTPVIGHFKELKRITGNSAWCFPSPRNPNTHRGYFDAFWEKVRELAEIEQTMHDIRHYFARTLLNLGYDNETVGRLLGHKNGQMVSRVYGSSTQDSRKRALQAGRRLLAIT